MRRDHLGHRPWLGTYRVGHRRDAWGTVPRACIRLCHHQGIRAHRPAPGKDLCRDFARHRNLSSHAACHREDLLWREHPLGVGHRAGARRCHRGLCTGRACGGPAVCHANLNRTKELSRRAAGDQIHEAERAQLELAREEAREITAAATAANIARMREEQLRRNAS